MFSAWRLIVLGFGPSLIFQFGCMLCFCGTIFDGVASTGISFLGLGGSAGELKISASDFEPVSCEFLENTPDSPTKPDFILDLLAACVLS